MWLRGSKYSRHLPVFLDALELNWKWNSRTQICAYMACWCCRQQFKTLRHNTRPCVLCFLVFPEGHGTGRMVQMWALKENCYSATFCMSFDKWLSLNFSFLICKVELIITTVISLISCQVHVSTGTQQVSNQSALWWCEWWTGQKYWERWYTMDVEWIWKARISH